MNKIPFDTRIQLVEEAIKLLEQSKLNLALAKQEWLESGHQVQALKAESEARQTAMAAMFLVEPVVK